MKKKNKGGSNTTTEVGRDVLAVFKDLLSLDDLEKFKEGLKKRIENFKIEKTLTTKQIRDKRILSAVKEFADSKDLVRLSKKYSVTIKEILDRTNNLNE